MQAMLILFHDDLYNTRFDSLKEDANELEKEKNDIEEKIKFHKLLVQVYISMLQKLANKTYIRIRIQIVNLELNKLETDLLIIESKLKINNFDLINLENADKETYVKKYQDYLLYNIIIRVLDNRYLNDELEKNLKTDENGIKTLNSRKVLENVKFSILRNTEAKKRHEKLKIQILDENQMQ